MPTTDQLRELAQGSARLADKNVDVHDQIAAGHVVAHALYVCTEALVTALGEVATAVADNRYQLSGTLDDLGDKLAKQLERVAKETDYIGSAIDRSRT